MSINQSINQSIIHSFNRPCRSRVVDGLPNRSWYLYLSINLLYFVKCYHSGWKICFIPSISDIFSQKWYFYVQYTRRLISFCYYDIRQSQLIWPCYLFLSWPALPAVQISSRIKRANVSSTSVTSDGFYQHPARQLTNNIQPNKQSINSVVNVAHHWAR